MSRLSKMQAVLLVMGFAVASVDAQTVITGTPDVKVNLGAGESSFFRIFNSSNTELLRVQPNGNVGIGTAGNTDYALELNSNIITPFRIRGTNNPGLTIANGDQNKFYLGVATAAHAFIDNTAVNDVALRAYGGGKIFFSTAQQANDLTLSGGNVGIGTAIPSEILTVQKGGAPAFLALSGTSGSHTSVGLGRTAMEARLAIAAAAHQYADNADGGDAVLRVDSASERLHLLAGWGDAVMTITNANVGIGVVAPAAPLQIAALGAPNYPASFKALPAGMLLELPANGRIDVAGLQVGGAGIPEIQSTGASSLYLNRTINNTVVVGIPGNNTGRLEVNGDISLSGNINAKYQDLAEWVPSMSALAPGTVVVLDSAHSNHVVASLRAYDTAVAGVVSAKPGIALGEAGDSKSLVATTGRVRVRVDASQQPISIGDLLVTSDKPGVAMKSVPLDLQGIALHRPGTVLGKALEPLPQGEGEILVLLSLQ